MNYVQLAFNLTGKCNLECIYCAVKGGEKKSPDLESSIIIKGYNKIREIHPNSFLDLNCMGNGEPLINWNAIETISSIKTIDDKIRCFVTTNGTLQDKILELAKRDWVITVSYDGIYNKSLRGKSDIVQNTIKNLSKNNAKFLVRMTILPEFLENLKDSLDHIKKLGTEYVILGPIFPFGRYKDKKPNSLFDIVELYNSIKHAEKIGLKTILSIQEECTLATRGYYLMPDGKISICYVKYIEPTKNNRKKAYEQGCILYNYKNLFNTG